MTLAELHLGVLRTVAVVEREFELLPIEERLARSFAELVSAARDAGRKPGVADALIAATASAHDLPLWAHDRVSGGIRRVAGRG